MIEVVASGPLSTVQDRGRPGFRHIGVPRAGVVAPAWMSLANALVGNTLDSAVIECFEGGMRLRAADREFRLAHVGDADVVLIDADRRRQLPAWRSHRIPAGSDVLIRTTGLARIAVIAIRGLDITPVLGSASTYARAGLGGLNGRALAGGDRFRVAESAAPDLELACSPFETVFDHDDVVLAAVPGPQDDAFEPAALDEFFSASWTLSSEADRMGARLDGPAIPHRNAASREIVSDAIVPGSVQIPGSGLPIVMLADAHTAGGYPKIATVVSADLPKLAICRAGTRLRIEKVDVNAAIARVRASAMALGRHLASIRQAPADLPDTARLLAHNLVDGVVDGRAEETTCN